MNSSSRRRAAFCPTLERLEDRDVPATLLAVSDASPNTLLRFDAATPNATTAITVSGLNTGENILGIDYRPANGVLYAVTDQARLLTLTGTFATTGTTATVGTATTLTADPADTTNPFTASMLTATGLSAGVDFNPSADRLRVFTDAAANNNLRINADTGTVTTDTDLNAGTPDLEGAAYSGNFSGSTSTTL